MHWVPTEHDLIHENEHRAEEVRARFDAKGIRAINIMSAPGSGKTSLVAETLRRLPAGLKAGVVEGDVRGTIDAERLAPLGAPVWPITTGDQCHLDARQVGAALTEQALAGLDLVIVENVGNLVCPASFPIGEHARVVLLSVTEGDDKPDKYPVMFERADLLVVSKIDLLPHVDFQLERASAAARRLNGRLEVLPLSCRTGEGLDRWMTWVESLFAGRRFHSGAGI